jgi:hypothetical protein
MMNKNVPKVLVETWISLVRNKECSEKVQTRSLQKLTDALGSAEGVATYMRQHNIK